MLDIYREITDRMIEALENGTIPWKKPWIGGDGCISYSTGRPYSLLNHLLLGGKSGEYITFRQCEAAGGHVRRGEKAKHIVFWKPFEVKDELTGEIEKHFYLRHYSVFHLDQCEGVSPRWAVSEKNPVGTPQSPDKTADAIVNDYVSRSGVKLIIKSSAQAFYRPSTDEVVVPLLTQFREMPKYYSTLFHELTHSTGNKSRLDRIADVASFGSEEYSKEELVAELGSAFLMNYSGLETKGSFDNSAAYIQGWLEALRNDKRLIVLAASAAEKAVNLILGKKGDEQDDQPEG